MKLRISLGDPDQDGFVTHNPKHTHRFESSSDNCSIHIQLSDGRHFTIETFSLRKQFDVVRVHTQDGNIHAIKVGAHK